MLSGLRRNPVRNPSVSARESAKMEDNSKQHKRVGLLDDYLTEAELAHEIGKSDRTVKRMRAQRAGPPWTIVRGKVLYHVPAAREWLKSLQVKPVREGNARRRARGV
jgi:hypothetical protein